MAETYIDFGYWLMWLPLFGLGWFAGKAYGYCIGIARRHGPFGMALAVAVLLPLASLETSILKLIAALALRMLAASLLVFALLPHLWKRQRPARFAFRKSGV